MTVKEAFERLKELIEQGHGDKTIGCRDPEYGVFLPIGQIEESIDEDSDRIEVIEAGFQWSPTI